MRGKRKTMQQFAQTTCVFWSFPVGQSDYRERQWASGFCAFDTPERVIFPTFSPRSEIHRERRVKRWRGNDSDPGCAPQDFVILYENIEANIGSWILIVESRLLSSFSEGGEFWLLAVLWFPTFYDCDSCRFSRNLYRVPGEMEKVLPAQ